MTTIMSSICHPSAISLGFCTENRLAMANHHFPYITVMENGSKNSPPIFHLPLWFHMVGVLQAADGFAML